MKYTISITKEEYEAMDADQQTAYTLEGEEASATFDGMPGQEAVELAIKKKAIAEEHQKKALKKLEEAEARAEKLQTDLESAGGNKDEIEKVRNEHKAAIEALRIERSEEMAQIKADRNKAMIQEYADKFAQDKFTIPELIADKVASRIAVEEIDGVAVLRPRNADGTPSVGTLEDVRKEFLEVPAYQTIIKANVGDGGGASQSNGGGATTRKLSDMTATEEATYANENPDAYAAQLAQA